MPRTKVSIYLSAVIGFAQAVLQEEMSADMTYMNDEIRRVAAELQKHGVKKTMMIAVYGRRWCGNKEAITYDESSCYHAFFKHVGGATTNCVSARQLFADPVGWITRALKKYPHRLRRGMSRDVFVAYLKRTFGDPDPSGKYSKKNVKDFYKTFYGKCTPKGTSVEDALKSKSAVVKLGILVRLQNTLHVAEVTKSLRDHDENAVIQVQYDSVTIWLPAIETHPLYGTSKYEAWVRSQAASAGGAVEVTWYEWVGRQFSNGISTWSIEMHPDVAIFSGVMNRYAAAWRSDATVVKVDDEDWVDLKPLKFKLNPQNMIGPTADKDSELKDAPLFEKKAKSLLCRALFEGKDAFESVLKEIPPRIKRGDKLCEPTLYSLLKSFVKVKAKRNRKKTVYYQLAEARADASAEDMIIAVPKTEGERKKKWVVVPAAVFFSDEERGPKAVNWMNFAGSECHEQVHGNTHPFGDYDAKDFDGEPLTEHDLINMEQNMRARFEKASGEKVVIQRFAMASLEKPNNLHVTWRVTTKSGRACVVADPAKDMRRVLGKSSEFFDLKVYKNSLRMPSCPYDNRPASSYIDKAFLEADAKPFDEDTSPEKLAEDMRREWTDALSGKDYANYCVSARGLVNPVVIGVPPPRRKSCSGKEEFLFASEKMIVDLLMDTISMLTKDEYSMTLGKSGLDDVNASADTVYHRVRLVRKFSSSDQKLLDLHDFAQAYLVPYVEGHESLPKLKDLRHRKGNSSFISVIIPRTAVPQSRHDAFFPRIRVKSFEAKKRKKTVPYVELSFSFLSKLLRFQPDKGVQWLEAFEEARESETVCNITSVKLPLNRTDSKTVCHLNVYEVRNAIRERVSASRVPASIRPHHVPQTSYYVTTVFAGAMPDPDLVRLVKTKETRIFENLFRTPLPFQTYLVEWMRDIDPNANANANANASAPINKTIREWITYAY